MKSLSFELSNELGKGFSVDNLENMRRFYLAFQKRQTLSTQFKLSWSHYVFLTRIDNENERNFYEMEAVQNNWTLRELKRQFDSGLFERLSLSLEKEKVKSLHSKGQIIESVQDLIKDPYILEFVGLPVLSSYSESELEQKLIDKLEHFLLELGKGFTFVARQKRITIDEKHFAVDLVFYNRFLKCFVVLDLKIGELKHQDIGQMMMYVNYFDRFEKTDDENLTVGIILCKDKSKALVELTLPKDNNQIYGDRS
ncbi:MAG: PDDEXK nuclease domain-containing protein [Sulfurimonas sp.]